jgi:predicted ATPase/DNA-binding SARP family transcriptional activator/TolA-binding protein
MASCKERRRVAGRRPVEASRTLAIRLLGGFHVAIGGQDVPETVWRQKRAAAVVKLLALEPTHHLHREQFIAALWPELELDAGANNLRVALHHARHGLHAAGAAPGAFLTRDGELISLGAPELVRVDVDDFEAALRRAWRSSEPGASQAALDGYRGDLLPEDLYDDWAAGRRTALRASYLTLLRRLAQLHEQRTELDQAVVALTRLIAADPDDEEAHAALIRLYARTGRQHLAYEQYDRLVSHLDQELAAEPRPGTRELIAAIREDRLPEQAPTLVAAAPPAAPRPQGLPAPVDELIGRERERAELRHLVTTTRLVTLTGPGGVGKTRLALAVAHDVAAGFPDGAYVAELAAIDDPELVLPTLARAVGAQEVPGQPLLETLIDHLERRQVLLLVDNMEHLAAAAPLVATLLASCPGLKALITSRSRLKLLGEQEYPVPPLAVPDAAAPRDGRIATALAATTLDDVPAVALFVRRARAARPGLTMGAADLAAVAEICRRLDGLPLALELAAARVRLLPPAELLTRLAQPLAVLTGGPHDAPDRHRSLRATIAWSHDLLTPEEQDLFARLSVFAGGFTAEAVELLVDARRGTHWSSATRDSSPSRLAPGGTPAYRTLELVTSLVEQSLLRQTVTASGDARLSMLETIHEFARERLEFRGDADAARGRHAALFLAFAEQAEPELSGPDQAAWLDRLETEHDNLRRALTTFHESGEAGNGLRLAAALWRFWWRRGFFSEGRRWLERAIAEDDGAEPAVRATAHDGAGALAEAQGDLAAAAVHHQAALALRRELGDRRGEARSLADFGIIADKLGKPEQAKQLLMEALQIAREEEDVPRVAACLANLGFVALDQGELDAAAVAFRDSLALFRDLGDRRNVSYVLGGLGTLAFLQRDYGGAAAVQEEALRVLRQLGDPQGIADTVADLGHSVQRQGDVGRAQELYAEALHRYRELGDPGGAAFVLTHLGRLAREQGDVARATALLHESFQISHQIGEKPLLTEAVEGLAEVACASGDAALCARLLGAAEALREETGVPLPALHEPAIAWCVATARAALGDAGFAAARGEGRALAPEQALAALAIGDVAPAPDDHSR